MISKKAQHEIAGFVLIVLVVSVIGVIFLSLSFNKGEVNEQRSVEVSNLLESTMYSTSNCAINYIPQYRDIQDLIKECYKDKTGNHRTCLVKSSGISGDIPDKKYLGFEKIKPISVSANQGPPEHQPLNGNAQPPLLGYDKVKSKDKMRITEPKGFVRYRRTVASCEEGAYGGFYHPTDDSIRYSEFKLRDFVDGVMAPSLVGIESYRLLFYIREAENFRGHYHDNSGTCDFDLEINKFIKEDTGDMETSEGDVCETLEEDVKKILDYSLVVGKDSVNKAYKLDVYFKEESNNEEILNLESGVFSNCSIVVGGGHSIAAGSFGFGSIETELVVCR